MRHKFILLLCVLLSIPTLTTHARDVLSTNLCVIDEDETIEGDLFAFCEELIINGEVDGDVYGAIVHSEIRGTVTGSLYMVGGQLDIIGSVRQDIHFAGAVLRFNPTDMRADNVANGNDTNDEIPALRSTRSIKSLTLSTILFDETLVHDGVINAGYQLIINGDVNSEVSFWGSAFILNGSIDGNVYATVGDPAADSSQIETLMLPLDFDLALVDPGLTVGATGEVTRLLSYRGPAEGIIEGTLAQEPNYEPPEATVLSLDEPDFFTRYGQVIGSTFSTLIIIGILVMFFANRFLQEPVANLRSRPFASLAVGLLGFLLSFPIVLMIVVLSLSLLGILFVVGFRGVVVIMALVLGLVNVGGISIFYFVAIFVTRALVGLAIGRLFLRVVFNRNDVDIHRWLQYVALAVGVLIVAILTSLPFIGIIMNALSLFLGLGAILIVVLAQFERFRETPVSATPTWYSPSPAVIRERHYAPGARLPHPSFPTTPTPADVLEMPSADNENRLPPPGTDNLPEGFDWSFFEE